MTDNTTYLRHPTCRTMWSILLTCTVLRAATSARVYPPTKYTRSHLAAFAWGRLTLLSMTNWSQTIRWNFTDEFSIAFYVLCGSCHRTLNRCKLRSNCTHLVSRHQILEVCVGDVRVGAVGGGDDGRDDAADGGRVGSVEHEGRVSLHLGRGFP